MLYVWGKVTAGQLGLGSGFEEPNVNKPRLLPSTSFQDSDVCIAKDRLLSISG
jgi:hypothetical protein